MPVAFEGGFIRDCGQSRRLAVRYRAPLVLGVCSWVETVARVFSRVKGIYWGFCGDGCGNIGGVGLQPTLHSEPGVRFPRHSSAPADERFQALGGGVSECHGLPYPSPSAMIRS